MCRIDDCERHELWGGMCLDHLKAELAPKPKRRRKKKIDTVEVLTADAAEDNEERNDTEE